MTDHKNFKNESQDARRHDQHKAAHPDEKTGKDHRKANKSSNKSSNLTQHKRKE